MERNMSLDTDQIDDILSMLKLIRVGKIERSSLGSVAGNYFISCATGDICIRTYPLSYCEQSLRDEVAALLYFKHAEIPVPKVIPFSHEENFLIYGGGYVFAYFCLPGLSLTQSEITPEIADQAGHLLLGLYKSSVCFLSERAPINDYDLVEQAVKQEWHRIAHHIDRNTAEKINDIITQRKYYNDLSSSKKGIVHGDYFYENVLISNGHISGVIDFGDVYFGHPIMDVVIGSMEFSVFSGQRLDEQCFKKFISPFENEITEQKISGEMFYELLLLNCIRFIAYTAGLGNENDYTIRLGNFISSNIRDTIISAVDQLRNSE